MASILRPGNIRDFTIHGKKGSQDLSGNVSEHDSKSTLADIRYYENVLSNVVTLCFLFFKKIAIFVPTNPHPPVINIFIFSFL